MSIFDVGRPRGRVSRALLVAALAALATLAAAACRPATGGPGGKGDARRPAVPAASLGAVLPGPLAELSVAEALYAGGGGSEALSRWRPKRLWQVGGPRFDATTPFAYSDMVLETFAQEGTIRAFVLSTAAPSDHRCPRCAPVVGGVALTEVAGGWRVDAAEAEIGTWGSKGELTGTSRLLEVEGGRRLLVIEPVVEADGTKETSFVVVGEGEGKLAELLRVEGVRSTNAPGCGEGGGKPACHAWDFDWSVVRREGRKEWDLELRRSGTRPNPATGRPEPFSDERTFRWDGKSYALAAGGRDAEG